MNFLLENVKTTVRPWRKKRLLAIASIVALGLGFVILVLALEYRPAWYSPAVLTDSELQRFRMDAIRVVDYVGDQLVDRNSFEMTLSDDQLNAWLSGLDRIWPEAARRVPNEFVDPFVAFEHGVVRTAARMESDGWRAIVSSDYTLELSPDHSQLIVRLISARCGTVTLPRFIVMSFLKPYMDAQALSGFTLDQLYDGKQIENRFLWPNGKRLFRIDQLDIEPGAVRIRIEPL